VYSLGKLLWAHEQAKIKNIKSTTATCSLMREYFSKGSEKNIKITTVEDIDIFKALLHMTHDNWIK